MSVEACGQSNTGCGPCAYQCHTRGSKKTSQRWWNEYGAFMDLNEASAGISQVETSSLCLLCTCILCVECPTSQTQCSYIKNIITK